eukprot:1188498-Prorocentrum_minimum.AAC.2
MTELGKVALPNSGFGPPEPGGQKSRTARSSKDKSLFAIWWRYFSRFSHTIRRRPPRDPLHRLVVLLPVATLAALATNLHFFWALWADVPYVAALGAAGAELVALAPVAERLDKGLMAALPPFEAARC